MSLMQDRLIQALPTSKTLKEAKLKAGYSPESRQVYRKHTKAHIAQELAKLGISKESLTKAYQALITLTVGKEDYATTKSSLDSIAKMHNFMKDGVQQGVALFSPITEDKARRILGTVQEGQTVDKPVETHIEHSDKAV